MSFSVFEFHNFSSLTEVQATFTERKPIERVVKDSDEKLISELREIAGFPTNNPESLQIDNTTIQYIFFEGYTERIKDFKNWSFPNGTLRDRDDRINPYLSKILMFEYETKIYGIIFFGINRAKAIVRDCFPAEIWGGIDPVVTGIQEDLLYWLFKRYIDTPKDSLSSEYQLHITALESYMGKTRDNVNAMRGEGSRISTILGTLAFLFNNEELKAIRPAIQHGNEKVLIEIGLTGTFKTWTKSYRGQLFKALSGDRKENAIAIFIFLKILPSLIECYHLHKGKDQWSPQLKVDFLKRLGTMIREEVDSVLDHIEKENREDDEESEVYQDNADEDYDLEIDDEDDDILD